MQVRWMVIPLVLLPAMAGCRSAVADFYEPLTRATCSGTGGDASGGLAGDAAAGDEKGGDGGAPCSAP